MSNTERFARPFSPWRPTPMHYSNNRSVRLSSSQSWGARWLSMRVWAKRCMISTQVKALTLCKHSHPISPLRVGLDVDSFSKQSCKNVCSQLTYGVSWTTWERAMRNQADPGKTHLSWIMAIRCSGCDSWQIQWSLEDSFRGTQKWQRSAGCKTFFTQNRLLRQQRMRRSSHMTYQRTLLQTKR